MELLGGIVFAVVGFSIYFGCLMYSLATWSTILAQVNERLPEGRKFGQLWWGPIKKAAFWREYERLFPDGTLRRKSRIVLAAGVASLVTTLLVLSAWARRP